MINATDLTTIEVRTHYVQPLIESILAKTNLSEAKLGIQHYCATSSSTTDEAAPTTTSLDKGDDEGVIGTLYQEIALYRGKLEVDDINSSREIHKSYAEILEEATALSAYMNSQEQTLVATVASSALVSFLIPQCDYLNFLRSYYFTSTSGRAATSSEASAHHMDTLAERLTNAIILNQESTTKGGGVFPYSASRMRPTTGDDNDDDGFTTAYFYRFLHQGLASYLSCGMALYSSKTVIRKQACEDMIRLISMAICPVQVGSDASIMPFAFQLSHLDRFQLVRVCKELATTPDATTHNNQSAVLKQLRESLFGFASYVAHSDKEAAAAYEALVHVSLRDESCIQFEFKRLLQTLVESKSSYIINSTCSCIQDILLLKDKGKKTKLFHFALRLLAKHFDAEIKNNTSSVSVSTSDTDNVTKRQKLSPDNCKPFRLIAILKAARVLFSSISSGALQKTAEGELDSESVATTKQMIQNAAVLLQCSLDDDQLLIVQSASEFLAHVLSYETAYLTEKSNVKHIFTYVRQSLLSANNDKASIIDALKPVIVTCSRQSGTFAVSILSFAIKNYSTEEKFIWHLATYISIGNPLAVSKRLSELGEDSSIDEDIATCKIRTILSSAGKADGASTSATFQRCLSLAESISDRWVLFKLVRVAFETSNFPFARTILEKRLLRGCSRQQSFMWLKALSKLSHGEEVLAMNGSKSITESLELLSSCNSLMTSLAALEQNGKFHFQLEFMRLRMDTLNLITITRSLCVETLMTEGISSGTNNRSNLFRKNITKSFGLLVSRYNKMYILWGLHRCQQTRSTLRTLQAMCQLLSEFTKLCAKETKNSKVTAGSTPTSLTKSDEKQSMNITLSKLRTKVLEQMKQSKQKDDSVSHASGLLLVLDAILKCKFPFPGGFFQIKPIPRARVNISADPNMLPKSLSQYDDHDITVDTKSGSEIIDVVPGLATKVILSGVLPEKFITTVDVEIIAWATFQYEGQLYEEDDAVDSDVSISNGMTLNVGSASIEPVETTTLLPGGKFIMHIPFEALQEGYYQVNIDLGCRDVRGGKWIIPTLSPLTVIFRVDDEGSV